MRRRHVVRIATDSVSQHLRVDRRTARLGRFERLQHQYRGTLARHHALAVLVEWLAAHGRDRAQPRETDVGDAREGIRSARQHQIRASGSGSCRNHTRWRNCPPRTPSESSDTAREDRIRSRHCSATHYMDISAEYPPEPTPGHLLFGRRCTPRSFEARPRSSPSRHRFADRSHPLKSIPESSSAMRAAATASCDARPKAAGGRFRMNPAGSKSFTSAPMCTGNAEVSNDSTGPMPFVPAVRFFQKTSRPAPIGVTSPMPVMTTLRIRPMPRRAPWR